MFRNLVIATALIAATAYNTKAQIGFGPEAGFNVSNMQITPPGSFSVSKTALMGARLGAALDANLTENIYLQSGAYFTMKGNKRVFSYSSGDTLSQKVTETLRINYLEVPVSVVYKTGKQGMGRFFCGLGIAFSYAVGGTDNVDDNVYLNGQNQASHSKVKVTAYQTINDFDMGLNVTAGYELHTGLFFRAFYTMGISNLSTIDEESDKNRIFGLSAGYYFGKDRHKNLATEDIIVE